MEYVIPHHATNESTAGNCVLCESAQRLYLEKRSTAESGNIRGLNLAAVKHATIEVTTLPL
jgi:hypothetical protein